MFFNFKKCQEENLILESIRLFIIINSNGKVFLINKYMGCQIERF